MLYAVVGSLVVIGIVWAVTAYRAHVRAKVAQARWEQGRDAAAMEESRTLLRVAEDRELVRRAADEEAKRAKRENALDGINRELEAARRRKSDA